MDYDPWEDTLITGGRAFGFRLSYVFSDPERYDIIVFRYPLDESQKFVKRIIGLPGETLEIIDGKVYIDGSEEALEDEFVKETPLGDYGPYEIPQDSYFVLGDNRNNSKDSRVWGVLSKDEILGKVILSYWPKVKFFNSY